MTSMIPTPVGSIHWHDYGGQGQPIVLVHGLGGSIVNWDALAPELTNLGHVVALDLPGFGFSPPANDWKLETHARALTAFIEHQGEPVALIGNSLGGLLSEMVSAQRPDLVEFLVLISPATPPRLPDPNIHWPTARRLLIQATPWLGTTISKILLGRYEPEELVSLTLASVAHDPARIPDHLVASFIDLAERRRSVPWAPEAVPKTGTELAKLLAQPQRFVQIIRAIKAPTLVVQGLEDRLVSPTSVEWACSLRTDWQLVQLENTGHTPQLDAVEELGAVIGEWLQARMTPNEVPQLA